LFVSIIEGNALATALLRNAWEQLQTALSAGEGWIRSAGGVDGSGHFTGLICLSSSQAWSEMVKTAEVRLWLGNVTAHLHAPSSVESSQASVLIDPGHEPVGFLQFIRARTSDVERFTAVNDAFQVEVRSHRPDVVGSFIAWLEGDRFIEAVLFTSEQDARDSESREFPGGIEGLFGELMQLTQDIEYRDVREPWLATGNAE
jgi:hypothetical protein